MTCLSQFFNGILNTVCCCKRRTSQNPLTNTPEAHTVPMKQPGDALNPISEEKLNNKNQYVDPKNLIIPEEIWFSESEYTKKLMDMPNVVVDKIFENLSLKEILLLRKVNHDIRDYLDYSNSHIRLKNLQISIQPDAFLMSFDCKTPIIFKQLDYEVSPGISFFTTSVEFGSKCWEFEEIDFEDLFYSELGYLLRYQKASVVLESLRIEWNFENHDHKSIIDFLEKILKSRRSPLKVKVLVIFAMEQFQVLQILQYLDPKLLEVLYIKSAKREKCYHYFGVDRILEVDQIKNLKTLSIRSPISREDLMNLAKFPEVYVVTDYLESEDFVNLKNTFLKSSTFRSFEIECPVFQSHQHRELQISDLFGACIDGNDYWCNWLFRRPNDEKNFLELKYSCIHNSFRFIIREISSIPSHYPLNSL